MATNEQFGVFQDRSRTRVLYIVAVVAVLVATLSPLNPFPRNGVMWLTGAIGLKFVKNGLVVSNQPLNPPAKDAIESYSIELLVKPASVGWSYTILGFYVPARPTQFLVRQWTDGLLVTHDPRVDTDRTRTIKFDVDHAFVRGRLVLVTLASGPNGTTVYLDGQRAESFPRFKIARNELAGQIVLGTSPSSYHPWSGELRGLAIYSKELTPADALRHFQEWTTPSGHPDLESAVSRYNFAEGTGREVRNEVTSGPNLEIPAIFSVPHKAFLSSPAKEFKADRRYAFDVLINVAGFVPLGLISCAYFGWNRSRWQAILIATVSCGTLSLLIEILQYYIPRRGSGMTDVITNTLGAAVGAILMQAAPVRRILTRMKLFPETQRSAIG